MKKSTALWAGLIIWASFTHRLDAQIAAPAAPAAPAAAAPAATTAASATPPGRTLWNFLGITPEGCAKCREKFCKCPLGQLINNMTAPLTLASGGIIQPCCPTTPSAADLAKLTDPNANVSPAEAAAAKIKADEAGAAARRAAIRYLGTVDCHYFPEAEKGLIAGLRADRNECVRLEAALALANGCCCTKETIAALTLVVSGAETDNNPSETSERVKTAAAYALQLCLMRHCEPGEPAQPVPPESPPEAPPGEAPAPAVAAVPATALRANATPPGVQLTAYSTQPLPGVPANRLLQQAGKTLAETVGAAPPGQLLPSGKRSLAQILDSARYPRGVKEEISYEEAALSAPVRQAAPGEAERSADRASLAFDVAGDPNTNLASAGKAQLAQAAVLPPLTPPAFATAAGHKAEWVVQPVSYLTTTSAFAPLPEAPHETRPPAAPLAQQPVVDHAALAAEAASKVTIPLPESRTLRPQVAPIAPLSLTGPSTLLNPSPWPGD